MLKEYWFLGDELIGISIPLRQPVHFVINTALFCSSCGQVWARRIIDGSPLPVSWSADHWTECPSCKPRYRKGMLKLITYEEAILNNYSNVPTAILAYEFLWLYLAEQAND